MTFDIEHNYGSINVRKFDCEDFVATIWIGNTNCMQAMGVYG